MYRNEKKKKCFLKTSSTDILNGTQPANKFDDSTSVKRFSGRQITVFELQANSITVYR